MSQLSGRSSSESRKTAGGAAGRESSLPMALGHPRNSSLVSTLDVVSCAGGHRADSGSARLLRSPSAGVADDARCSSSSTEESGNDSFTCSEIEYDNGSVSGEKLSDAMLLTQLNVADDDRRAPQHRASAADRNGTSNRRALSPGLNFGDCPLGASSRTLLASDHDSHLPVFRPQQNAAAALPIPLGWECLLSWGPDYRNLAAVFKDIAQLPESVRAPCKSPEEYV